jgi:prepilin-type N-terminal cleavage/methylation domain-containing protein
LNQRGLTLVEMMVALVVISLSVLAVYQMFITGRALITEQYHRRYALERAQAWMEKMKYYENELDTVPLDFSRSFIDTLVAPSDEHVGVWADCVIDVEHSVERDPGTGMPYYSTVSVTYNWEALSGREYSIKLKSKF